MSYGKSVSRKRAISCKEFLQNEEIIIQDQNEEDIFVNFWLEFEQEAEQKFLNTQVIQKNKNYMKVICAYSVCMLLILISNIMLGNMIGQIVRSIQLVLLLLGLLIKEKKSHLKDLLIFFTQYSWVIYLAEFFIPANDKEEDSQKTFFKLVGLQVCLGYNIGQIYFLNNFKSQFYFFGSLFYAIFRFEQTTPFYNSYKIFYFLGFIFYLLVIRSQIKIQRMMYWDLEKKQNDLECFRKFFSSQIKIPILVIGQRKNKKKMKEQREQEQLEKEEICKENIVFTNEIFYESIAEIQDREKKDEEILEFLEQKEVYDVSQKNNAKKVTFKQIIFQQFEFYLDKYEEGKQLNSSILEKIHLISQNSCQKKRNSRIDPYIQLQENRIPVQIVSRNPLNKQVSKVQYFDIRASCSIWDNNPSVVLIFEEKTENIKNEKLTNLNKYKDQLLNSVSHELQTPLNSIQQTLELNQILNDPQKIKNNNYDALQNCYMLAFVIQGIIILGQPIYRPQNKSFDLIKTINYFQNLFQTSLKQKNLCIDFIISQQPQQNDNNITQNNPGILSTSIKNYTNFQNQIQKSNQKFQNNQNQIEEVSQQDQLSVCQERNENSVLKNQYLEKSIILDENQDNINENSLILENDKIAVEQILFHLLTNAIKFSQGGQILIKLEKQIQKNYQQYKSFEGKMKRSINSKQEQQVSQQNLRNSQQQQEDIREKNEEKIQKFKEKSFITSVEIKDLILWKVTVQDGGIGIDENLKEKLFKLFTRQCSDQNKSHGVGIGLTISNKMAQVVGGRKMEIMSEKGKGSSLSFWIQEKAIKSSFLIQQIDEEIQSQKSLQQKQSRQIIHQNLKQEESIIEIQEQKDINFSLVDIFKENQNQDNNLIKKKSNFSSQNFIQNNNNNSQEENQSNNNRKKFKISFDENLEIQNKKQIEDLNSKYDQEEYDSGAQIDENIINSQRELVLRSSLNMNSINQFVNSPTIKKLNQNSPLKLVQTIKQNKSNFNKNQKSLHKKEKTKNQSEDYINNLKQYFKQLSNQKNKPKLEVLLVDDTVFNNITLNRTLTIFDEFLDIKTSLSGENTIKLVQEKINQNQYFDIIFMDVNMPEMSGIQCIQRILLLSQSNPLFQKPIFITNTAASQEEEECLSKGADFHLTKPINYQKLQIIIQKEFN